jgi:hypothetical protein
MKPTSTRSSRDRAGGKPFGHPGEFVDDVTETLWHPADLELSGVVRDGLDAQHVLACGGLSGVSSPKWTVTSVRSHRGVSVMVASRGEGLSVPLRLGRCLAPNKVRRVGSSGRDRVRSTMLSNTRSIWAPTVNGRLRLYSTWWMVDGVAIAEPAALLLARD